MAPDSGSTPRPEAVPALGDFVDGRFLLPRSPTEVLEIRSPADLDDRVGEFPVCLAHVDAAVAAARAAQPAWERTPLEARLSLLRRLGEEIDRRGAELAVRISREIGKPLWEAKTEVGALAAKIRITLDEGLPLVRGFELEGGRLSCRFRPHGVLAVIGPFNFPLHLAHGHVVPALATGNAVVLKPSELAPATAQLYAECFEAAGLPRGVFNLVNGRGTEGARLSAHPDVDGVLFTGSYRTGVAIAQANLHRPGFLVALELGGKNSAVVLADAPFEKAVHDVVFSAFATTGQRCTSISRVIVERGVAEPFVQALSERAAALRLGHPMEPDVFLGPLASAGARERFRDALAIAAHEGATPVLPSTDPEIGRRGHYVTPSVHLVPEVRRESAYQQQELFAPDLAVFVAEDADHACDLAEATDYGLAAAVFTRDEGAFEHCASRLRVGCVAWNAPTAGSSSRLPFGGVKNSGNHRPAGVFSSLYCAYPVAVTRGEAVLDTARLPPGMRWAPAPR